MHAWKGGLFVKDEQSENREQSGTLGNLDADALQARMDWAQESPFEQTDKQIGRAHV